MSTQIKAPPLHLAVVFFAAVCTFVCFPHLSYAVYKSSSTNNGETAGNASTATVPSGVSAGDIVVCVVSIDDSGDSFTWPLGFNELYDVDNTAGGHSHGVAWKRLTAADSGSYTITHANGTGASFVTQCAAFSGRSSVSDPTASSDFSNASNGSPVSVSAPAVTASEGDDIIWIGALDTTVSNPGTNFSAPGSYTERQDTNYIWNSVSLATRDNVSAGSTGTVTGTATLTNGVAGWHGFLVRIPSSVTFPAPSVLAKPPNNLGLVGYWSFNEATSTIATDFSGNRNHGTLENVSEPPTTISGWTTQGKRGAALRLDGTDDVVRVTNNASLNFTSELTATAWIKLNVLAAGGNDIIGKVSGTDSFDWYMEIIDDTLNFTCGGGCGAVTTVQGFQTNTWYHVAATYVDSTDTIKLYVNGVETAYQSNDASNAMVSSGYPVLFGELFGNFNDTFDGVIDDARLYNRALSPSEITALYGSGAVRAISASKDLDNGSTLESGLVTHWSFDGSDFISTIADISGTGNHTYVFDTATSSAKSKGRLGQSLYFSGDGGYVERSVSPGLSGGSFTLSTWLKRVEDTAVFNVIVLGSSAGAGQELRLEVRGSGFGDATCEIFGGPGVQADADILAGTGWHHIVCTYDATTNEIRAYVNGVLGDTDTSGNDFTGSNDVYLNNRGAGGYTPLSGYYDDVRIYNRVLTPAEVKQLYNLGQVSITP